MTTTAAALDPPVPATQWARVRTGLLGIWAGITGAAPHVLLQADCPMAAGGAMASMHGDGGHDMSDHRGCAEGDRS